MFWQEERINSRVCLLTQVALSEVASTGSQESVARTSPLRNRLRDRCVVEGTAASGRNCFLLYLVAVIDRSWDVPFVLPVEHMARLTQDT